MLTKNKKEIEELKKKQALELAGLIEKQRISRLPLVEKFKKEFQEVYNEENEINKKEVQTIINDLPVKIEDEDEPENDKNKEKRELKLQIQAVIHENNLALIDNRVNILVDYNDYRIARTSGEVETCRQEGLNCIHIIPKQHPQSNNNFCSIYIFENKQETEKR